MKTPPTNRIAHRGAVLHCLDQPDAAPIGDNSSCQFIADAVLLVEDGHVAALGPAAMLLADLDGAVPVHHHQHALIVPGFVDTHVHYPQLDMIAAYGTQLLDWLNTHAFPTEAKFADYQHAYDCATAFLDQLLSNGTTTAQVFGTVHQNSVEAFFTAAAERQLRMIAGKVMMDRHAPDWLCDTAESGYHDSRELIRKWHHRDRLQYAVTPRFAPTSTVEQLQAAARLLEEYPGVRLHTHLAENRRECEWVAELFPQQRSYLDVYDHFGLAGSRSLFAHTIYLDDDDWTLMHDRGCSVAHCPTSNLFIGSGLMPLRKALAHDVCVGFGTDVGGGDSLSMLRTINEAYKVQQLQGYNLPAINALYHATLGGARALGLESNIGNFELGKEADFVVLDYAATATMARRSRQIGSTEADAQRHTAASHPADSVLSISHIDDLLFMLLMLGDDRCVRECCILGEPRLSGEASGAVAAATT